MREIPKKSYLLLIFLVLRGLLGHSQINKFASSQFNCFVENKGQVIGIDKKIDTTVRYTFKSNHANVYIKNNGFSYFLKTNNKIGKNLLPGVGLDSIHQLDLLFLNALSSPFLQALNKTSSYNNFYYPHCPQGILGVKMYREVVCKNIYQGIDIRYYNKKNSLEYDFIVKKNADPKLIQIQWKGANDIQIGEDGTLSLYTHLGIIKEQLPDVYQIIDGVKFPVSAKYKFIDESEQILGFDLGMYNLSYDLVIDPWLTYFGGAEIDIGLTVALDDSNHLYVGGITGSKSLVSKAGFRDSFMGGFNDGFISKFTTNGQLVWSTYYGGNGGDNVVNIQCNAIGDLYIAGLTFSDTGIAYNGYQDSFGGQADGFILKMNSRGERIWATYVGGADNDACAELRLDDSCNIYICGTAYSDTGIAYKGIFNTYKGLGDGFVAKYDSSGRKIWATYYGGTSNDNFSGLYLDKNKSLYLSGQTLSNSGIATTGAFQTVYALNRDAFLVKMNSNGALIWGTYFGGNRDDYFLDVGCDTNGNVYTCGASTSSSSVAIGGYQTVYQTVRDGLVAKFNPSGNLIWSTYLGGANQDYAQYLDVDLKSNHVFVTGSPCASQDSLRGIENNFITRFFPDGKIYCSSYFGENHEEDSKIIVKDCRFFMTGWTYGDITPFNNPHQDSFYGKSEAYIAEFNSNTCGFKPIEVSYDVNVEDNNACDASCNGKAELIINYCTPFQIYNCEWSTGKRGVYTTDSNIYIDQLCAGQYWVYLTVDCGPSDTVYFSVRDSINGKLPVFLGKDTFICYTDSILLKSNLKADRYEWQNLSDSDSLWVYDSGWYSLKVSKGNCIGVDSIYIEIPLYPFSLGQDSSICEGDSILLQLDASIGQFIWYNSQTDSFLYAKDSGIYWLEINNKQCQFRDTMEIKLERVPRFDLGRDTVFCIGDSIQLKFPFNNLSFEWDNGSSNPLRTVSKEGIYYAKTRNRCGEFIDSLEVSELLVSIKVSVNIDTQCLDKQQFQFSGTGTGSSMEWDFGDGKRDTGRVVNHQYNNFGKFEVFVKSRNSLGCSNSDTIFVWVINSLFSDFDFEVKTCSNFLELKNLSNEQLLFYWEIDSVNYFGREVKYRMTEQGDYYIKLYTEDSTGKCKDTLSQIYTFNQNLSTNIKIPNVFTPNEDNFNDCFQIGEGSLDCLSEIKIYIFDRWGIQVYNGEFPEACWNGKVNNTGGELPDGTYYYLIDGIEPNGKIVSGVIYLLR
jgi:gliding motility-associated-like protein